jgi:ribosomal protein S18 acetylase RimI-like enzyme
MKIRKTTAADLPKIAEIYEYAREFMRRMGNGSQWGDGHPAMELIENDIREGTGYVCVSQSGEILAVFFFSTAPDPTYAKIDGAWLNDEPYGVVHRIARAENASGAGAFCLNWCFSQIPNLRIDTHEDNKSMLNLLQRLGFVRCGIIQLENGEDRAAFQINRKPTCL